MELVIGRSVTSGPEFSRWPARVYAPDCRRCPRLVAHRAAVHARHPEYHCAPVPPFGDPAARLLLVGLAPGEHGANATGRPFTGDYAGLLLYKTLYQFGLSSAPASSGPGDGLELYDCRISNAVKCLPPANKPTPSEAAACRGYLAAELEAYPPQVILALGRVGHDAALAALGQVRNRWPFAHAAVHRPEGVPAIVDTYHCSRYNTQTGRLTEEMFHDAFRQALDLVT